MKILIVAIPRSGSQTLLKSIGTCLNLTTMGEPFNESVHKNVNWNYTPENNEVVKSLISINDDNPIEFYKNYSKLFDRTILLSRKNTHEAAESYSYQVAKNTSFSYISPEENKWHQKYTYIESKDLDFWKSVVLKNKNNLQILSKELNLDIDWYEDLYSGDKEKIVNFSNKHKLDLDISEFSELVNPKYRLRQFKKTII